MIEANEAHNAEIADILISVDLTSYSSSNYDAGEKIIRLEYEGAGRKPKLLSRLALDEHAAPAASLFSLSSNLPTDGTDAFVMDTRLGPLAIGGSVGNTGHQKWFFRLGRIF
jgi:hypothetical protein